MKLIFNIALTVLIAGIVLFGMFVAYIFVYPEKFRYEGDLIGSISYAAAAIVTLSGLILFIVSAIKKSKETKEILNGSVSGGVCPYCRVNVSPECMSCPNCKNKLK